MGDRQGIARLVDRDRFGELIARSRNVIANCFSRYSRQIFGSIERKIAALNRP
jgi:hypothetical protein